MVRNHHTPPSPDPAPGPGTESTLARPKFTPTPEPWKIAHSNYANAPFVIFVGDIDPDWDRRYPLTGVDWIAEVKCDESEQHQEQVSNARLMLAAPRMLALLRHFADGFTDEMENREKAEQFLRELEGGGQ